MLNVLGQVVFLNTTGIVNGELYDEVNMGQAMASGNYFVRVIVGNDVYLGKIILQQ